jgi:hypothetical protein
MPLPVSSSENLDSMITARPSPLNWSGGTIIAGSGSIPAPGAVYAADEMTLDAVMAGAAGQGA